MHADRYRHVRNVSHCCISARAQCIAQLLLPLMTRLSVHCLRHPHAKLGDGIRPLFMLAMLVMLQAPCTLSMTRPFVHSQRHLHVRTLVPVLVLVLVMRQPC